MYYIFISFLPFWTSIHNTIQCLCTISPAPCPRISCASSISQSAPTGLPLVFSRFFQTGTMAYEIMHLTGQARLWETELWECQTPSFQMFVENLRKVFGHDSAHPAAAGKLLALRQGQRSEMDYSVEFHIVASRNGWPEALLDDAFLHKLADYIKDMLIAYDRPLMV